MKTEQSPTLVHRRDRYLVKTGNTLLWPDIPSAFSLDLKQTFMSYRNQFADIPSNRTSNNILTQDTYLKTR